MPEFIPEDQLGSLLSAPQTDVLEPDTSGGGTFIPEDQFGSFLSTTQQPAQQPAPVPQQSALDNQSIFNRMTETGASFTDARRDIVLANPQYIGEEIDLNPVSVMKDDRMPGDARLAAAIKFSQEGETSTSSYVAKRLPFVGAVISGADLLHLRGSIKRIGKDEGTSDDYLKLGAFLTEMERTKNRKWAGFFLDTLTALPGFALEFMATAGVGAVGKKAGEKAMMGAATKILGKYAQTKAAQLGVKATGFATGTLARTAAMPQRVFQSSAEEYLPEFHIGTDDKNKLSLIVDDPKDGFWEAFKATGKGFAKTYIEIAAEQSGAAVPAIGKAAFAKLPAAAQKSISKLKAGVAAKWLRGGGNRTINELAAKIKKGAGWHGILGEIFEEHVSEISLGATGLEDNFGITGMLLSGDGETVVEGLKQWSAMASAIGVFPAGRAAISKTYEAVLGNPSRKNLEQAKRDGIIPEDTPISTRAEREQAVDQLQEQAAQPIIEEQAQPLSEADTQQAPNVNVGNYVQWNQGGVDRFSEPQKVNGVSSDGKFVFVEGSKTGIPSDQVQPVDGNVQAAMDQRQEVADELDALQKEFESLKPDARQEKTAWNKKKGNKKNSPRQVDMKQVESDLELLGIDLDTPLDEARQKYRAASAKHHPDIGGSVEQQTAVERAWHAWNNSPVIKRMIALRRAMKDAESRLEAANSQQQAAIKESQNAQVTTPEPGTISPPQEAQGEAEGGVRVQRPGEVQQGQEGEVLTNVEEETTSQVVPPVDPPVLSEPPQPSSSPENLTSVKNEVVTELRERRNLDPLETAAPVSNEEIIDAATNRIAQEPDWIPRVLAEVEKNPRALQDDEVAGLQIRYRSLYNDYHRAAESLVKAAESGNEYETAQAQAHADSIEHDILRLEAVAKRGGTQQGRAFARRKILLREDYSLATMTRRAQAANGGQALSPEALAQIQDIAKRIAAAEQLLDGLEAKVETAAQQKAIDENIKQDKKQVKRRPKTQRKREAQKKVDDAWKELEGKLSGKFFSTPLDPDLLASGLKLAKAYAELGVVSLQEFLTHTRARIGPENYQQVEAVFIESWSQVKDEGLVQAPNLDVDTMEGLDKLARKIQRAVVESGITDREQVVDTVHNALLEFIPELTRRQTMDALSGYGKFTPFSKDEIDLAIKDINGQLLQLAKLEDMQQGQAPLATGRGRPPLSDAQRRLIQQVNEAKKRGGFEVVDAERQLRTALDAAKRATVNRIADLDQAIAARERLVDTKTPLIPDAELTALRKQRDASLEQYRQLFPKRPLTEQQQITLTDRALDKAIADLEADLDAGRIGPKAKPKRISTPVLEAKRARLEALRQKRAELRDLAGFREDRKLATLQKNITKLEADLAAGRIGPPQRRGQATSPEIEQAQQRLAELREQREKMRDQADPERHQRASLQAYKSSLKKRLADYQQRIADKDFTKRPRKELPLDKDATDLKFEVQQEKAKFDRLAADYRRSQLEGLDKVKDLTAESLRLSRAILTSMDLSAVARQGGISAFAHPIIAAKAMPSMFRAAWSKENEFQEAESLRNRPNAPLYDRAGLSLTVTEGALTKQEEVYMGRWAERVPFVAASERAYVSFLNRLRADVFDSLAGNLSRGGKVTPAEAKVIAKLVNTSTGRADLGSWNSAAAGGAIVFFAPRYVVSRFQVLAEIAAMPVNLMSRNRAKRLVAREYARYLTGVGVFLGLASLAIELGWDDDDPEKPTIEFNPLSTDFGKIKIGETRIDPLSGLSQTTVILSRVGSGMQKNRRGDILPLRKELFPILGKDRGFNDPSVVGVIGKFLRSKLSPVFGGTVNALAGENIVGEVVTPGTLVRDFTVPLAFRDIYNTMREHGVPAGSALSLLAIFGMGISTYGPKTELSDMPADERAELFSKEKFRRISLERANEMFQFATPAEKQRVSSILNQRNRRKAKRDRKEARKKLLQNAP